MKLLIRKIKSDLLDVLIPTRRKNQQLAQIVSRSQFFDETWYLHEYPDVASSGVSPALHYVLNGYSEGRLPGPLFDEEYYISQLPKFSETKLPPIVHYEQYGRPQGLKPVRELDAKFWWKNLFETSSYVESGRFPPFSVPHRVTIIIPVFNGVRFVKTCLDSVLAVKGIFEVIVIDDCSEDVDMNKLLNSYDNHKHVTVLKNSINQGFTKTINRGIEEANGSDVIILNSDTIVPMTLIRNLKQLAYSDEAIGTVTPLSNFAGPFSIPIEHDSSLQYPSPNDVTRLLSQGVFLNTLEVPTGHGFCMYIKSKVFNSTGLFDDQAFPRGYGEENDLCFKARTKGWKNVVDSRTYVFHDGAQSFKQEKVSLLDKGLVTLNERYSGYNSEIENGFSTKSFLYMKRRVSLLVNKLDNLLPICKPRILFVIATEDGGTAKTNKDLMGAVQQKYETFLLKSSSRIISLYFFTGKDELHLKTYCLNKPITPQNHSSGEYDNILMSLLHLWSIDIIHVRQIAWHSAGLVKSAREIGIPTVYSIHDFYPICPSVKLLDNNNNYCGGTCTPGHGTCNIELWPEDHFINLKHNDIKYWRQIFNSMLENVHTIVTTCEFAKQVTTKNLPSTSMKPFHVIPHGRDFDCFRSYSEKPKEDTNLKLLMLGTIVKSKGSDFILPILEAFLNIEIHLLGKLPDKGITHPRLYCHGPYDREEVSSKISEIRPSWGLLLSIWPETWCHTLTEMWANGIPVVAFNNGAVMERMSENDCGLLVENSDYSALFSTLRKTFSDEVWQRYTDEVTKWQNSTGIHQSVKAMSYDYMEVYNNIVNNKVH